MLIRWAFLAVLAWPAQATTIGVIDLEAVVSASQKAEVARSEWLEEVAPLQTRIARVIESGQREERIAVDSQQNTAAREQARAKMRELQVELLDLQRQVAELIDSREQEFLRTHLPRLEALTIELAEAKDLDLVIHADIVIWGKPAVNLSDDLLQAFDQTP